jgi:crotonobetainyl-CoA:carnitine CoA-transferase CaiB-like acyl-CoA transferase
LSVAEDPQVKANGYLVDTTSTTGEDFVVVQPPVQFNGSPAGTRPAPSFNADGDEILSELGYDDDRVLGLRLNNAVT